MLKEIKYLINKYNLKIKYNEQTKTDFKINNFKFILITKNLPIKIT